MRDLLDPFVHIELSIQVTAIQLIAASARTPDQSDMEHTTWHGLTKS